MKSNISLFISDTEDAIYQVSHVVLDDQEFMRGLPLMRVGTWNGLTYTADDLRTMAANHERIRAADAFEPGLKTRHTYDWSTGEPENVDMRDVTLGWFTGLHYDDLTETLLGDVRVVDWQLPLDMKSKKLRYISAEVAGDYELDANGEKLGPAIIGAAFVDLPGVSGMPWEIVMNAKEFQGNGDGTDSSPPTPLRAGGGSNGDGTASSPPAPLRAGGGSNGDGTASSPPAPLRAGGGSNSSNGSDDSNGNTNDSNTEPKGANDMSAWDKVKQLFGKLGLSEEDLKVIDEPEAGTDNTGKGTGGDPPSPEATGDGAPAPDATGDGAPAPEATGDGAGNAELLAQLAQERKAREELAGQVTQLTADSTQREAEKLVDGMVADGSLAPASHGDARVLLHDALITGGTVKMLRKTGEGDAATETMTDVPRVEAITEFVKGLGHAEMFGRPPALTYSGSEDPNAATPSSDEELDAVVARNS